ncbi:MAG: hypothetical protein RL141_1119 [Candidatus Parcubacteria bacterium]|jgi:hypothetical protein
MIMPFFFIQRRQCRVSWKAPAALVVVVLLFVCPPHAINGARAQEAVETQMDETIVDERAADEAGSLAVEEQDFEEIPITEEALMAPIEDLITEEMATPTTEEVPHIVAPESPEPLEGLVDFLVGDEGSPIAESMESSFVAETLVEREATDQPVADPQAVHACVVTPFHVDVSGQRLTAIPVSVTDTLERLGTLTIGSFPPGLSVAFADGDPYVHEVFGGSPPITLVVTNQVGSQGGSFDIALAYHVDGQTAVCHVNLVNQPL